VRTVFCFNNSGDLAIRARFWHKSEKRLSAQTDSGNAEGKAVLAGFSLLISPLPAGITPPRLVSKQT
jgi:hypothetical protein